MWPLLICAATWCSITGPNDSAAMLRNHTASDRMFFVMPHTFADRRNCEDYLDWARKYWHVEHGQGYVIWACQESGETRPE